MNNRLFRIIFAIVIFVAVFELFLTRAFACIGARALAIGGAFTGVADDTQATYWNPAGLVKAEPGIMTMHTFNLRQEFNYDDYVGISFSKGNWGLGLEYIKKSTIQSYKKIFLHKNGRQVISSQIDEESDWIQIGGALSFSYASFGLNIRYLDSVRTTEFYGNLTSLPVYLSENDSEFALDFGVLTEFGPVCQGGAKRAFSAGLLIQDLNKPELLKHEHIVNFRPGLGFRPLNNLLFSIEIYDLTSEAFQKPQIRAGYEWVVSPPGIQGGVALRGGVYHLNEKSNRAFTGGIGYSYIVSGKAVMGFDYALMWWDEAQTLIHLLSVNYKF